jgi:hypothetical protein
VPPQIFDEELDLTGQSSGFEAVPAGRYNTTLFKWEVAPIESGKNQGKANETRLQFKVNGEMHPDHKGRILFDRIQHIPDTISPEGETVKGSLWRYEMLLTAFGVPPQQRAKIRPAILADYMGQPIVLEVTNYEYPEGTGTRRNGVKKYHAASGLVPGPVTAGRGKKADDPFR